MGEIAPDLGPPVAVAPHHDLSRFDCGVASLNDWLRQKAWPSEGRTARTYVVCERDVVVGYHCIASAHVERRELPGRLRRAQGLPNRIPVAIIGRLARDIRYRGTGLGHDLLQDALQRIVEASHILGIRAVLVHAIDDKAAAFYRAAQFVEYPEGERILYLPIETIRNAL